jgi:hypothetical protein
MERAYNTDLGGLQGYGVHEFAKAGFRDLVDMGTTSELRLVTNILSSVTLTQPKLWYAVESVYRSGSGGLTRGLRSRHGPGEVRHRPLRAGGQRPHRAALLDGHPVRGDAAAAQLLSLDNPLFAFGLVAGAVTFGLMAFSTSVRVGKTSASLNLGDAS